MRTVLLALSMVVSLVLVPVSLANQSVVFAAQASPAVEAADSQQAQPPQINVEVNKGGGRVWYASPVWVAIGVIALVLVVMLIVMAARGGGGGTTVVRG
jgi:hypothetical protein